jgi:hypothetical protein
MRYSPAALRHRDQGEREGMIMAFIFGHWLDVKPGAFGAFAEVGVPLAQRFGEVTGLPTRLSRVISGGPLGMANFAVLLPDLESLAAAEATFLAEEGKPQEVSQMHERYTSSVVQTMHQVVRGPAEVDARLEAARFFSLLRFRAQGGQMADAVGVTMDLADVIERHGDAPVFAGIAYSGPLSEVILIGSHETLKHLEETRQAVDTDPAYADLAKRGMGVIDGAEFLILERLV